MDVSVLEIIGQVLVDTIKTEAVNEFAKRGWSTNDPMGGPPIGESFKYEILGKRTVVIRSTFYGLAELTSKEGIPERRMTWLTQQGAHKDLDKNKGNQPPKKFRSVNNMPLVVPITTRTGEVIFRTAPLHMADAWVHPGIARFNFMERALKKARKKVDEIMTEYCGNVISAGIAEKLND